ncbi:uncharacterized protein [Diadema antillarum]|uniref:uncharacterized protein n=1 Tax=Diadema antillarum TaxID=105358 RepID=UPI003A86AF7C
MAAIQWQTREGGAGSMDGDIPVITPELPPTTPISRKSHTLPPRAQHPAAGDFAEGAPTNNNSATLYRTHTLPSGTVKPERTIRRSLRSSVKRRSLKILKNLKTNSLRMSSHSKGRNHDSFAAYTLPSDFLPSSCIIDTDEIDKGEVIFFAYSDDGSSYTKQAVPICNACCPKHRIRWSKSHEEDDDSHGDDYDSGGEFGDCDELQVDEVLTDYSLKEAPVHINTLGKLPSNHSFEAMSDDEFHSSFAYCTTERLNTIRRSTRPRKSDKTSSSASLGSAGSRKSRFVANVNRKMTSKAWPLRSLWQFLTRQKDESHRVRREEMVETMESATRYIRIASHFEDAYISVNLIIQTVEGASQYLRDVQVDLIRTALKAFFTVDDNVDVAWADHVPTEIQRQLALGLARVHFPVPDIRQCVACLLLSPDAAVLLRRQQCILLKSIAEVLECHEQCLLVMQTRATNMDPGVKQRTDNGTLSIIIFNLIGFVSTVISIIFLALINLTDVSFVAKERCRFI